MDAEREPGVQYAKNMIYTPPSSPEIKVNEQYFENSGTKKPEDILCEPAPAEKPDIKINTNAAYFKWRESQNAKADGQEQTADAADGSGGESVHPNPEFPDEESIRQAVLADEFAAEQAQNTARKKEKRDAGSLLKDLIFGKE